MIFLMSVCDSGFFYICYQIWHIYSIFQENFAYDFTTPIGTPSHCSFLRSLYNVVLGWQFMTTGIFQYPLSRLTKICDLAFIIFRVTTSYLRYGNWQYQIVWFTFWYVTHNLQTKLVHGIFSCLGFYAKTIMDPHGPSSSYTMNLWLSWSHRNLIIMD